MFTLEAKLCIPISGANATGHENTKNKRYETWYTIFLPYTSLNGPTNKGPSPSPITNRLRPKTATSLDTLNSFATPASVEDAFGQNQIGVESNDVATLTIVEAHVTQREAELITSTAVHFLKMDRF
jgi:hypothetical protein